MIESCLEFPSEGSGVWLSREVSAQHRTCWVHSAALIQIKELVFSLNIKLLGEAGMPRNYDPSFSIRQDGQVMEGDQRLG